MTRHLDEIDKQLLQLLQEDGRMSNLDLAQAVRLSAAPCLRRVQRLREEGFIRSYVALVDADAIGRGLTVFVNIRLERHTAAAVQRFEAEIVKDPAVLECYWTAGETDYLVKVAVDGLPGLDRLLLDRLTHLPGVATVQSTIAVREVKYSTALPVD